MLKDKVCTPETFGVGQQIYPKAMTDSLSGRIYQIAVVAVALSSYNKDVFFVLQGMKFPLGCNLFYLSSILHTSQHVKFFNQFCNIAHNSVQRYNKVLEWPKKCVKKYGLTDEGIQFFDKRSDKVDYLRPCGSKRKNRAHRVDD